MVVKGTSSSMGPFSGSMLVSRGIHIVDVFWGEGLRLVVHFHWKKCHLQPFLHFLGFDSDLDRMQRPLDLQMSQVKFDV